MLGGFSINEECFAKIRELYPQGTILELGSGLGTYHLAQHYTMYSVEHNEDYIGKENSNYIYAPIVNGWYAIDKEYLPEDYGLLLIDGPPSTIDSNIRLNMKDHLDMFNLDAIIIVDDVHRKAEELLSWYISEAAGRPVTVYGEKKKFAVI